jgi:small subunit ribosomal protein S1
VKEAVSNSSNNNAEKSTLGDLDVLAELKAKMEKGEK